MSGNFINKLASLGNKPTEVLLIEDNSKDAAFISELLHSNEQCKFNVTRVDRLKYGFEYLDKKDFDVVLLDLTLPDSLGFDTLKSLKDRIPKVPILILTGSVLKREEMRHCIKDASGYLVKGYVDSNGLSCSILSALNENSFAYQNQTMQPA
ncbi:MAG: response regulator [Candidatus Melainabacteria bacterium]|nr:response regulator [Candidatus Melainabacteria bacterium]